jgi:hypothetical protein
MKRKKRKEKNIKEKKEKKKKDILTPPYSLDENARRHF